MSAAFQEEEALGKAYDGRLLRRLWRWVAPYRAQVFATIAVTLPLFVLELAPAWIIKNGLDRVLGAAPAPESAGFAFLFDPMFGIPPLAWLATLYLLAMLTSAALQYWNGVLMSLTGQSAMRDLRRDVFAHLQRLHLGFFDRHPVGRLVTRVTNDVENIAEMFSSGIVALVTDLGKMVGFAIVLFLLEPHLAGVSFLVVPLLAAAAVSFRRGIRDAFRKVRVRIARINATLQETVTGMKVVQLFTREARNQRDFDAMNAEHRDAWRASIHYDAALFAAVEIANGLTTAVIVGYGALLIAQGSVTAGTLYVFIDWMRRFFLPLRDLSAKYSVMQSAMASSERIFQLLDTEPAIQDRVEALAALRAPAAPPRKKTGEVVFEHVWFAYQGEDWILKDVSFRVAPGERIALVGSTGAGKTSIIKLLDRLYDVTRGRILLDGVDLRDIPQPVLRRRIAMVLQDVFLFSGTVASNIGLEREDVTRDDIERAARAVEAHRFLEKLPHGYDTVLRERGSDLSGGQRQLLSFARALAHGGDVLILDEATSSVDPETELLVQRGIHALLEGRTAIVIAHRLSTIQDVDRIHVLHKGRIVESGSHDELLARRGAYHRLYRLQIEPDLVGLAARRRLATRETG
ncbi:MAG: antibiotic ABC transporter ATP-binding protein [Proteobacteria bacterium]|nr:MAG: antibiotic ABC transporter ATP-binding protein [Pseudomonadota bacterium]